MQLRAQPATHSPAGTSTCDSGLSRNRRSQRSEQHAYPCEPTSNSSVLRHRGNTRPKGRIRDRDPHLVSSSTAALSGAGEGDAALFLEITRLDLDGQVMQVRFVVQQRVQV